MAPKVQGTVTKYNSKRGFGFIKPSDGSDDVFVHWSEISTDDRWPKLEAEMAVTYVLEWGEDGKAKATKVTKAGGGKVSCTGDDKVYGDFRYPGTVKWFRGWTGQEGGFGFITMGMEATVGDETVAEGEEVYVSREELLAENPVNPKICGGMEVEFLLAKTGYGKFCACEVTQPGGEPIGDLPEREPREKTGKGKGKGAKGKGDKGSKGGKSKGKGKGVVQKAIVKTPVQTSKGSKGKGKGKASGKGKGKR